jgi:hypothetical protein
MLMVLTDSSHIQLQYGIDKALFERASEVCLGVDSQRMPSGVLSVGNCQSTYNDVRVMSSLHTLVAKISGPIEL